MQNYDLSNLIYLRVWPTILEEYGNSVKVCRFREENIGRPKNVLDTKSYIIGVQEMNLVFSGTKSVL